MFTKATKKQAKLRCAIFGPSGSGKTFTSLRIASGMGNKIAVIDTERKTASKYADRFSFDVCDLEKNTIDEYIKAIKDASGYDVLIIDSLSHAWKELLEHVELIAKTKYRDNTFAAWKQGNPIQNKFIDAILTFPGHIIATMRSKTEWQTEKDERTGKNKPVKIGLAPEQGKGIEYEFDLLMEINDQHLATVSKDRTGKYQDSIIEKPGEDFGKSLIAWLNEGDVEKPKAPEPEPKTGQVSKTAFNEMVAKVETSEEWAMLEGILDDQSWKTDKSLIWFSGERVKWNEKNAPKPEKVSDETPLGEALDQGDDLLDGIAV